MVGLSVDSKPKYFKGWPYTEMISRQFWEHLVKD